MNAFLHTYLRRLESEFTGRNSGNRGQFNLAFFPLSTSICCGGVEKKDKSFTYSKKLNFLGKFSAFWKCKKPIMNQDTWKMMWVSI